jgi:hypothetical protein
LEGNSKYYPGICLEGLRKSRKISVRIADTAIEFRTEYLPNPGLERYLYTTQPGIRIG